MCSSILDRKVRLEMGWKLLMVSELSPGSLRMGVTAVNLGVLGTELEFRFLG